ncbi:MAG: glutamate racemase [Clostridia bacterium]|nr:glutamate racemase [Clostridia bacterium]
MSTFSRIGVFDSGLGGLTVLNAICAANKGLSVVYFGDTARVPYGSRTPETIIRYAEQDVRFLLSKGVEAIVVACGTVSAIALEELRKEFSIPIIGVIEPACDAAAKVTKSKHICVIGTQATVHSHAYSDYINRQYPDMTVSGIGCPLFVPLIENGFREDDPITKMTVERYLSPIRNTDIDTLILGCTHYPFLSDVIHETLPDVRLIDIGVALSEVVGRTLTLPHNISDNFVEYCFSDRETGFKRFDAEHLKDLPNGPIKSINIESF